MPREKQEAWEYKQKIEELEHDRDSLASENTRLRRERDQAVRSGFASQEETTALTHRLSAKEAEVEDLQSALQSAEERLEEIQTNSGTSQARFIQQERELLSVRGELSALRSSNEEAAQSRQQLTSENAALHEQVTLLSGIREERDGLETENKYLVGRNKLLKSQVGNYMVGSGRVGKSYYVLQAMSHIPVLGSLIRRTSQDVYDAHQKPNK